MVVTVLFCEETLHNASAHYFCLLCIQSFQMSVYHVISTLGFGKICAHFFAL